MGRHTAAGRAAEQGAALAMVLAAVAVIGLATLVPLRSQQLAAQRERERELLFAGHQYRDAIARYAAATPVGAAPLPHSLDDLVEDRRFPQPVRHLRRLYADPMTGAVDWQLLREQGGIAGVASRSTREPLKRSGFRLEDIDFAEARSYADWRFLHKADGGAVAANRPAQPMDPAEQRRNECLRAYSRALNLCARDPASSLACRTQARGVFMACLQG